MESTVSSQVLHLKLPQRALRRLDEVGIYCRTEVRLEYQQQAVHGEFEHHTATGV